MREAALDLQRRAPPVDLSCLDESGSRVRCDSTEAVLRDIDRRAIRSASAARSRACSERFFGDGSQAAR